MNPQVLRLCCFKAKPKNNINLIYFEERITVLSGVPGLKFLLCVMWTKLTGALL